MRMEVLAARVREARSVPPEVNQAVGPLSECSAGSVPAAPGREREERTMGLLGKLFGSKEYPPLDPASADGRKFEPYRETATAFAAKLHDKLEVIPSPKVLYCFIGNPPDQFGVAWFEGGDEHNLKTLMKAKNLPQARVNALSDEIRRAYERSASEPRYEVHLGKKKVLVTPSPTLERELVKIIHEAEH
jgi:hypothetical protein